MSHHVGEVCVGAIRPYDTDEALAEARHLAAEYGGVIDEAIAPFAYNLPQPQRFDVGLVFTMRRKQ